MAQMPADGCCHVLTSCDDFESCGSVRDRGRDDGGNVYADWDRARGGGGVLFGPCLYLYLGPCPFLCPCPSLCPVV